MTQNNTAYLFSMEFDNQITCSQLILLFSFKIQKGNMKKITSKVNIPNKTKIIVEEKY